MNRFWFVERGNPEVIAEGWERYEGVHSLDLNGTVPSKIYQDVPTHPGEGYMLSFAMAGNPGGLPLKTLDIWWDGRNVASKSFDSTGKTQNNMGWQVMTVALPAATAVVTRLAFESTTVGDPNWSGGFDPSWYGPFLDDISLTSAVPEPASIVVWSLLGTVGAVVAYRRRRKAA
jgi:hypothetical protein